MSTHTSPGPSRFVLVPLPQPQLLPGKYVRSSVTNVRNGDQEMPEVKAHPSPAEAQSATAPISATELRANVYKILDEVLATGQPRAVRRKGQLVLIQPASGPRLRLADLPKREGLACTPDELIGTSWEREWEAGL